MNEIRKLLFGQRAAFRFKPLCEHCVRNCISNTETAGFSYSARTFFSKKLSKTLKSSAESVCKKLDILSELVSKQCNLVVAQRIRRSYQILLLYRNLYGERLLKEKVASQLNKIRKRPLVALLSASIFSWDKQRVTDDEIERCHREANEVYSMSRGSLLNKSNLDDKIQWELIVDKEDFKVWRHQLPDSNLYKYRVLGHFRDIPARAFFNTQVDVHYWKDWDQQTIDVSVVDRDKETGSEVIQWLYKFPYPMYPREYVYVRRCVVDERKSTMTITARATNHPSCPKNSSSVRMETYTSQMVIQPHKGFDENGFSYVMSYCDDPKTNLPPTFYNYVASSGCHEFLERMHQATLKKHEKTTPAVYGEHTSILTGMVHQ